MSHNDKEQKIEIDIEEYEQLIKNQKFLQALEEMGVDNWEGYSEAIELVDFGMRKKKKLKQPSM